ncbi:hypothetical protein PVAP13_4KG139610 [Panicum virgatum]|uniref:Uncharacterized protein n=1 Tax=Panicum virgatum TaxID=38727 RepID=A0A8T0TLQ6_PANVG|nr:hypothetical protein PVAP13_4KG139215 [Panicum virgatum]KAG2611753.1 hypothetical protein PVAP13_4KG139610 [Panicum virgatum]
MSPPPHGRPLSQISCMRALPKSPKVLRALPPRVLYSSPKSHTEPRAATRPVLLSQIHPTSSVRYSPGAAGRHVQEPRRCPPAVPVPNPPCVAPACHSPERETGQPRRPRCPGAAASTHGRAGGTPPTARAARNAGPVGGCGPRERVRDLREPGRALCSHPCGGPPRRSRCCTVWNTSIRAGAERIDGGGREAAWGRIDPLVCLTARALITLHLSISIKILTDKE